jgi:ribose-phosphate pyrophosphokinase
LHVGHGEKEMKVILGPASTQLGEKVAETLKTEAVHVAFRLFPDGENYVRLEGMVQDEDVAIVQTTGPPQDTHLVQLALMADAAKRNGARKVVAVVPYLAYARQDRMFLRGEAISVQAVARMLDAAGVEQLLTVNVHDEKVLDDFPFPARSVSAVPLLAEYFFKTGFKEAFVLSPDKGAIHIAEEAASVLGGEYGYLEKKRDRFTGQVSIEKKTFDIRGKHIIIFDDIISSGGTLVSAANILKELTPRSVHVACVHPLLMGDAERNILNAGVEEVIGTDSVPSRVSKVSLAPLISRELAS